MLYRAPFASLMRRSTAFFTRERAPLALLLALTVAVRLPLMPFQGYWHDLATYVYWGNTLVSHGFGSIYAVRASDNAFPIVMVPGGAICLADNYPPGMSYLFGAVVLLYNATLAFIIHAPLTALLDQNGIGPFIAKLPLLVADLVTTVLLYREARKRRSQRFAWLAAAAFAFSPAVLYDGMVWGQTDALGMLPVLIAVFAILSKRNALGGVSLAVATLIKAQSIIFLPLVLLYLWRWARRDDLARFIVALAGTALLLLLPILVPRFQLFDMLYNMRTMSMNDIYPITRDAFNFWWLLRLNSYTLGSSLLGVNIGLIADALFGAVTVVTGAVIWRHREPAYLCFGLAMEAFGFFMFMGGQLDRYLFPFLPLMLAALIVSEWKSSDRLLILYVSGTILCLLNMSVTIGNSLAGFSPMIPYVNVPPLSGAVSRYFGGIAFITAAYIVVTFVYAMRTYVAERFAPYAQEPSSTDPALAGERAPVAVALGHAPDALDMDGRL